MINLIISHWEKVLIYATIMINLIISHWEKVLIYATIMIGIWNGLIAFLKVMGYPALAAWCQKLEDAISAAIKAFMDSKKPPTAAGMVALFIIVACGASYADVTGTQAVIYLNKDHSTAQATVFEVIKSKNIPSMGKWNALIEGWSIDVGGAYDNTKVLKNGVILIGKDFGVLANYLPITFPLSDKLVIKAYFTGAYIEDIWNTPKIQSTEGVGYISASLKF